MQPCPTSDGERVDPPLSCAFYGFFGERPTSRSPNGTAGPAAELPMKMFLPFDGRYLL
jgi:hypothetical protein